jgi:hypothetical protein
MPFSTAWRSGYTQRAQVETVISMLKRNRGHAIAAQSYGTQNRKLRRLAIVLNMMVLLLILKVFDGACQDLSISTRDFKGFSTVLLWVGYP